MRTIPILVLALAVASPAMATSARALNPLDGVKAVNLNLTIGGSLRAEGGGGLELFQGDFRRADAAKERIIAAVTERFRKDGISVDPKGRDIVIGIYGRPVDSACGSLSVFTVGLYLWGDPADVLTDDELNPDWDRGWIGIAPNNKLEEKIVEELLAVLEELLVSRLPEENL